MKNLNELGQEYLEASKKLRQHAKVISEDFHKNSVQDYRDILSKTTELKKTATMLKKYGNYLCKYYERGRGE